MLTLPACLSGTTSAQVRHVTFEQQFLIQWSHVTQASAAGRLRMWLGVGEQWVRHRIMQVLLTGHHLASHVTPHASHTAHFARHMTHATRHTSLVTRHPSPFTLHPSPFTLHPSPFTLHPSPFTLHRGRIDFTTDIDSASAAAAGGSSAAGAASWIPSLADEARDYIESVHAHSRYVCCS